MIQLYNDDCNNILPTLVDSSVDAIIVDPPYNINYDSWDNDFDLCKCIDTILPSLKLNANIIIFQGWSNVVDTIFTMPKALHLQDWIIWDRIKGRGGKRNFTST